MSEETAMTAPGNAALAFDEPPGGYPYGATVTATLTGTSENTTAVTRILTGTLTDPRTGESAQCTGTFTVAVPNPLTGAVSETDVPTEWTPGESSQAGADFTATFTAPAA